MTSLESRNILVTGAGGCIGNTVVRALAGRRATIYATDFSEEALADLPSYARVTTAALDVTKRPHVEAVVDAAAKTMGGINGVVHLAGITKDGLIGRIDEEDWDKVLDTSLTGGNNVLSAARGYLMHAPKVRGWNHNASVVFASSIAARLGSFGQSNYAAAKAGLEALARVASKELCNPKKGTIVTVNCVAPGLVESPMIARVPKRIKEQFLANTPAGRFATPEEVAGPIAFLLSKDASYITGQTLAINGGMMPY